MSQVRLVLLVGSLFYALIFAIELIQGHILWQAIIGIFLIAFLSSLSFTKEEHLLHDGEMIAVWSCILLFGLYAILKSGGII